MHQLLILLASGLTVLTAATGHVDSHAHLMGRLQKDYDHSVLKTLPQPQCTAENTGVRREWNTMHDAEKADYIRAVKCLRNRPPMANGTVAKTRYEEFILAHISQTLKIHFSGLLLPWHRYFVWLHEQALRTECGYSGYQPYWDWSKYVADPESSTIFSTSELSFGKDGEYVPHGTENATLPGGPPPPTQVVRTPGTGGGCVYQGPFANLTLSLQAANDGASTPIRVFHETRCLKRDLNLQILSQSNSYQNVTDLILNYKDIYTFHEQVETSLGVHTGGHTFIGGENFNLFTSPGDPLFFLHHGMLDRVWAIWQSRDFEGRKNALTGTGTWGNYPPSPNVTLEETLITTPLEPAKVGDIMSTINGIMCYRYE